MSYSRSPRPYTRKPKTDIFTPNDTDIDRRQCRRVVPMRVLALGLGRTGTVSLREALQILGFDPCYHMICASTENPSDCLMWSDALAAKYDGEGEFGKEQWDQLLGHCQAICDWPAVAFSKELMEAYPDAKVLLTTRDVDSWYQSTLGTANWRANDPELRMLSKWDWGASHYYPMLHKFWTCFFKGDFEKHGKEVFNEYYAEMRATVPPERLLEYHISEGWEPLCKFLDVPVPKVPFPHVNDTKGFIKRCKGRNRAQMYNVMFRAAVVGGGCIAGIWMGYSMLH